MSPREAGYTWKIIYERYSTVLDMWVPCHFYTTDCAVNLHLDSLDSNPKIRNLAAISID
jgi:hypothetical protein